MVFYFLSLFWLFAFFIVTQQSANRYFGMVFIYFLAALWMAGGLPELPEKAPGLPRAMQVCFYGIVFLQVGLGLVALEQDIVRPFSSSKEAP